MGGFAKSKEKKERVRGIVRGLGKAMIGGTTEHFLGEECEVTIIRPIAKNAAHYWVQFDDDPKGSYRIRQLIRLL